MDDHAQAVQAFLWLLSTVVVIILVCLGKPLEAIAIAIVGNGLAQVR